MTALPTFIYSANVLLYIIHGAETCGLFLADCAALAASRYATAGYPSFEQQQSENWFSLHRVYTAVCFSR